MIWEISIDTGGTFTDCLAKSPSGDRRELKILSSSRLKGHILEIRSGNILKTQAPWLGANIFKGYTIKIADENYSVVRCDAENKLIHLDKNVIRTDDTFDLISPEEVPLFAIRLLTECGLEDPIPPVRLRLGTTRGTNALLEKKGAQVTLLITKGFGDLLDIGDQQRPKLFSLNVCKAIPLTFEVIEVAERIDTHGNVLMPLEPETFSIQGESVAICLLNSFRNNTHEGALKDLMLKHGQQYLSISSEVTGRMKYLERTETTVVNAYLQPILTGYLQDIYSKVGEDFYVMTSAGTLAPSNTFAPKDSLLSGPAGGITGAATIAASEGFEKIVSFDMGGTSTDVALFNRGFDYAHTTEVGNARIQAPALNIHTIAAGGGSICSLSNGMLRVGPESGGAFPGPACYGQGGPFTITDINLLAGRIYPKAFAVPLHIEAARAVSARLEAECEMDTKELLPALLQIANEKMAAAIRRISLDRGTSLDDAALVAFGGAGGQHACAIASILGMEKILVPKAAGLLSAYGISTSEIGEIASMEIYRYLHDTKLNLEDSFALLEADLIDKLAGQGISAKIKERWAFMRLEGQETSLEISFSHRSGLAADFKETYLKTYGHWIEGRPIEITSIKARASDDVKNASVPEIREMHSPVVPIDYQQCLVGNAYMKAPVYDWEGLSEGEKIEGPAIVYSSNSTIFVEYGWVGTVSAKSSILLEMIEKAELTADISKTSAALQLFLNRFSSIVTDMGAVLERSSFSVNVKERLDFSCALLDANGYLVVNAPHIPVHLGSMGLCVREVRAILPISEGDIIITNHPAFGGSHLPDITLIAPVVIDGIILGYVANRAHHAEVGGITPGSMPPNARKLSEEGVIIPPQYLQRKNQSYWDVIRRVFTDSPYPTRAINENIADLQAGVASLQAGLSGMEALVQHYGSALIMDYMQDLKTYVAVQIEAQRKQLPRQCEASELLDDGSKIQVNITNGSGKMIFDFAGTSGQHPGNLNATPAIVRSVVLYVLRLMVKEDLPLNEGFLQGVEIILPDRSLVNPDFTDPLPAVVGGNTEISQRLCDTLLKAFNAAACSQGTMNNLIFGNDSFGFYETIGGGTGAGSGFHGASAVHQHMTNTRITDAEIIEHNFPVLLREFSIRRNSGGKGKWQGGDGITRIIEFLEPVEISVLTQHRNAGPYGMAGGSDGNPGNQYIIHSNGSQTPLSSSDYCRGLPGDRIVISTPGGGGFER